MPFLNFVSCAIFFIVAFAVASVPQQMDERPKWCPEPWPTQQCIPSSGELSNGPQLPYKRSPIIWQAGLEGHSHYTLPDAPKAALFVVDPQQVYASCPQNITVDSLLAPPSTPDFDGHSPLCCEKFYSAVANINSLAEAAREKGYPVFTFGHIYRDFDGDGTVDNCGRICDFDVAGWAGWPEMWNLWNEAYPWSAIVYETEGEPNGFRADFQRDFYAEKAIYSTFTKPVVQKLQELEVDTVILTGFMTNFCITTSARSGHDLGFKIIVVTDAMDGPMIQELVSGIDENAAVGLYLGTAVADTTTTESLLQELR
eukprot:EG_transcript_14631